VRQSGKAVDASLAAFATGFDAARQPAPRPGNGAVPVTIGRRPPEDPAAAEAAAAKAEEDRLSELAATGPGSSSAPACRRRRPAWRGFTGPPG
jgi:indolepyruvate ferredoxin oxidoreductase beta subunit